MDVANTTATQTGQDSLASLQKTSSQGSTDEFNTFLTLLTAQIRNQDPLAPLDSTQFVEQLATFSGLEQQVKTNDQLEAISMMVADLYSQAANDWIGQDAEVTSSWLPHEGGDVQFTADLPPTADKAVMVVRDTAGDTVDTMTLDEDGPWTWDGKTSDGSDAGEGLYQMVIELYQDGEAVGVMEPRIITKVTQASVENGEVVLGFENRMTEAADKVQRHLED